ncbi:MAG TPA: DegT/DnrJ/EryC1/StrS family aminotransferase [Candidatus Acidoferrales bacterium]|nr:DegT/DnrJ/EryC1/StrS family aminotransferase [Candidatus Acidoferrales bacterium]
MKVPFLDLKAQYHSIKNEIDEAIFNVIENSSFVLGQAVSDFENSFASSLGVKHCIGLSSGTDGNHLVLWALGIGPGDEVIIPANTFVATAWGATLCGAVPVFVDCEEKSYNIDPAKVEAAITPRTKVIVAVHLYGQPADMDSLKSIAERRNLLLVEDAAQAHFAEYLTRETNVAQSQDSLGLTRKWKKVGTLSRAASFSFYPGKNLGAYGEAGAVLTNDDELAARFRMMRDHGGTQKYLHEVYGHNYRMEGIQGAVLGVKLKHLEQWNNARKNAAEKYREMLGDVEEIVLPEQMEYAKHVYHLFVVRVKDERPKRKDRLRNELQKFLAERGIATGLHYPVPLHLQPCFSHLGYKKGVFPITEKLAENGLSLPIYPEISADQLEFVGESIRAFFKN